MLASARAASGSKGAPDAEGLPEEARFACNLQSHLLTNALIMHADHGDRCQ